MAESIKHMEYVQRIVEYVTTIPVDFIPKLLYSDLPDSLSRPTPTLDGYVPDVLYRDSHIVIIGEAKTIHDVDNDHTLRQLCSYIDEVRCHSGEKHIVFCTNVNSFPIINNIIIRKRMRENLSDIKFHILDNISRVIVL